MPQLYPIHVREPVEDLPWSNLVPVLEKLFPVRFCFANEAAGAPAPEFEIVTRLAQPWPPAGRGSFRIPGPERTPARGKPVDMTVRFADDPDVPFPFRADTLRTKIAAEPAKLLLCGRERVLATSEWGPVWTVAEEAGAKNFESAFGLPGIGPEAGIKEVLNEGRFLEMLPLLCWLREIGAGTAYAGPPLRACFVFDDPNLHWTRYGFVDYRQIAARAARENYHVAFATIPLDTWFTHEATARVFRNNARWLSLAVHGNDHTKLELARDYTPSDRTLLLRQAIQRVERLERKTGLPVCRVMVPPHGACSEEMLRELPGCGFAAACLSHGSLRAHNPGKSWTRTVGFFPSELIQGCPVLPRWGMSGDLRNVILLAAFLGQPLVLRGHHQDLKNGVELLDELAAIINRLGAVSWSNLTGLSRRNYQWRMDGGTCRVRPLSRNIVFRPPGNARRLIIENFAAGFSAGWRITGINGEALKVHAGDEVSLPEPAVCEISITADSPAAAPRLEGPGRTAVAALFRRLLTEGRDRFFHPAGNV